MKFGISNIAKLVEEEHISLHRIAQIAGQSINATETGTFIHRVAELRALRHHRDEILAGKRYVELQVQMSDGSRGEIDLVTVRRNFHHIHDYKPIDLRRIEHKSWAGDFEHWLTIERRGDFTRIGNYRDMQPGLKARFNEFLKDETRKYKAKLDAYCDAYAERFGVPRSKVKPNVLPYYVKR